jgi:transcriptional regulator with XRE-family HTH domain
VKIGVALIAMKPEAQSEKEIQQEVAALCLGAKIRRLRQRRSLTLQDVSELSGLSKSLLSQIENEASAPRIPTLVRIAKALGVQIGYFFRQESSAQRISLVRSNSRQEVVQLPHNRPKRLGYRYVPLAHPLTNQHMEPFWIHFEPRSDNEDTYFQHAGEEFLYVQEGRLEFKGGDQSMVIEKGDSLYFESSMPHGVRNLGSSPASALAVIYTPDDG